MKRALFSADDFGLSLAVNEGIERAHREGVLSTASLMVAGDTARDAVARARRLPELRVGLHLVTIEGPPVLPQAEIPALLDRNASFPSDQLRLGVRYAFKPDARRQLAREIEAQFAAFAATGLRLDHANAHKHMHLHPTIGRMLIQAGLRHGLRALRIPSEPARPLGGAETVASRTLRLWTRLLRRQACRAGLAVNDHCFGLAWSGHMTTGRIQHLIMHLPDGFSEIYFHPASGRDRVLDQLMPGYEHEAELAALCEPGLSDLLRRNDVVPATWHDAPT